MGRPAYFFNSCMTKMLGKSSSGLHSFSTPKITKVLAIYRVSCLLPLEATMANVSDEMRESAARSQRPLQPLYICDYSQCRCHVIYEQWARVIDLPDNYCSVCSHVGLPLRSASLLWAFSAVVLGNVASSLIN